MMNILNELNNKFGKDIKKGLMKQQNISEKQASAAMNIALPTLMASVIRKVGTDRGTTYLQDLVDQEVYDGSLLNKLSESNPKTTFKKEIEQGEKLLPVLLGSSIIKENILNISGKITGLGYQSAKSTFSFLSPIVLNFVGKKAREKNLDKNNLVKLLKGQKGPVKQDVHPDISRELGLGTWRIDLGEEEPVVFPDEETTSVEEVVSDKKGGFSIKWFIWPLLLLGVLALLIIGILKGFDSDTEFAQKMDKTMPIKKNKNKKNNKEKEKSSVLSKTDDKTDNKTNAPKGMIQKPVEKKPVEEKKVEQTPKAKPVEKKPIEEKPIEEKPIEEKPLNEKPVEIKKEPVVEKKKEAKKKAKYTGPLALLDMVANRKVASVIDFGNLHTANNELNSNGKNTLTKIAEIMNANPNLNITIRGHHKKHTSNEDNFNADSQAIGKANMVKAYLETKAISSSRIKAVSMGYKEPVNAQDPGNEKNNRISIKTK